MKIQPDKIEYGGYRIAAYSTSNAITSIGYDIFSSFSRLIESDSVLVQTAIGHSLDEWHYVGDLNRDEFESAYRKNNGFILLGDSSSSVALTVNNVPQPELAIAAAARIGWTISPPNGET